MSQWISADITKPPESLTVLLYIVTFHKDGKNIWDDNICVGFYGNKDYDNTGFYLEKMNNDLTLEYEFLEENNQIKVIAWTLLPRKPLKGILENGDWND